MVVSFSFYFIQINFEFLVFVNLIITPVTIIFLLQSLQNLIFVGRSENTTIKRIFPTFR